MISWNGSGGAERGGGEEKRIFEVVAAYAVFCKTVV